MQRIITRTVPVNGMLFSEHLPGMAYQGEQLAHQFVIHAVDDSAPVALSGSVLAEFVRADGITVPVTGSIADDAAVVTLSGDCYGAIGRAELTIFVTASGATTAVYHAVTSVTRTRTDAVADQPGLIDLPALQAQFEEMGEAVEDAEEAATNANNAVEYVAPTETSPAAAAHAVGEYLIYNGTLYKVTAAIAVGDTLTAGTNIAAAPNGVAREVTELKSALTNIENELGSKTELSPEFVDNRSINFATGGTNSAVDFSYTKAIACDGYDFLKISMPVLTSSQQKGLAFYTDSTGAPVVSLYLSGIKANYDTTLSEDSSEVIIVPIPEGAKAFCTTWFASTSQQFSTPFVCELIKSGEIDEIKSDILAIESELLTTSENVLNPVTIATDTIVTVRGIEQANASYCATDYISVTEGDVIKLAYGTGLTESGIRVVTTYDANKTCIQSSGAENVTSYTVPANIKYVRISASKTIISNYSARISLNGVLIPYQTYYSGLSNALAKANYTRIELYNKYSLSALPEYFVNNLAYKPMGQLSTGYLCLVSDDGNAELETYTIPMIISKQVPCTFAVMKSSQVFQTQSGIDAVLNAINNYGCQIAQHGGTTWDQYDEFTFNHFLDEEKAYWDSLGITAYGAVCPQHRINNMIKVVAGGRFGCVRSGYNYGTIPYANYTNGARSNLYGLTSQSSLDGSVASQSAVLDACMQEHLLRIIHWHENEMDSSARARLESIIDYGKQIGIEFITMKDIPTII